MANAERPNKVFPQLVRSNTSRARKDIAQWRSALQSAESVENPKRALLYNIYDEVVLDAHITAEMQKRILAVAGADFKMYDSNGDYNAEATDSISESWFYVLIRLAMESKFWGHSLVEVSRLTAEGKIANIELIPRKHVRPEKGIVVNKQNDDTGLDYRNDQAIMPFLFEFGDPYDLGLFNKAIPHVLFKRFAQSAWSEFCEIYGMPLRYVKTNTKDVESINRLEQMLIDQATNSYAIIDVDEEFQYMDSSRTDGSVYEGLMKVCTTEISKLINGSVIGESSNSGSRAKETVGKEIQEAISRADKKWFEGVFKDEIQPRLVLLGYPIEGYTFNFEESKNIESEWKIASEISDRFILDPVEGINYIKENFGIPVIAQKSEAAPTKTIKAQGSSFFE